jgi:branched-chain amino acid transport system permease protein
MTRGLIGSRRGAIVGGLLFALGIVLPLIVYPVLAIDIAAYAIFAVAFDLLLGFAGLLSFGHALFWGGAGYVVTILIAHEHLPLLVSALAAILYAAVCAVFVGAIAIRTAGIYFAMITLALAQLQYFFAYQLSNLTGGENGLQMPGRGIVLGVNLEDDRIFYYLVLAIAALAVLLIIRVVRSPFGFALEAARDNEQRAISLGYRVNRFKLATFVLSGTLAGLAGVLFAVGNRLVGLDSVDWHTSGRIVMMSILGGIGTVFGPIVGASVFEALEYFVSKTLVGDKTNLIMGTIFAIVILVARRGIVGEILAARFRR